VTLAHNQHFTEETKALRPLKRYFIIQEEHGQWAITCRYCCQSWTLKFGGEKKPGNLRFLLDHGQAHADEEFEDGGGERVML
jgi:hypothetical protein